MASLESDVSDLCGFQREAGLESIQKRGFTHTGRSGERGYLSMEMGPQFFDSDAG
jgi:hypothetical protein